MLIDGIWPHVPAHVEALQWDLTRFMHCVKDIARYSTLCYLQRIVAGKTYSCFSGKETRTQSRVQHINLWHRRVKCCSSVRNWCCRPVDSFPAGRCQLLLNQWRNDLHLTQADSVFLGSLSSLHFFEHSWVIMKQSLRSGTRSCAWQFKVAAECWISPSCLYVCTRLDSALLLNGCDLLTAVCLLSQPWRIWCKAWNILNTYIIRTLYIYIIYIHTVAQSEYNATNLLRKIVIWYTARRKFRCSCHFVSLPVLLHLFSAM